MSKTPLMLALLAGGLLAAQAHASSWGDLEKAFPAFPCQDGWMACLVDGRAVSPEPIRDGRGLPVPSDLRIGWDLEPLPTFSPFVTPSRYTGELPVAHYEPEPEPEQVAVAQPQPTAGTPSAGTAAQPSGTQGGRDRPSEGRDRPSTGRDRPGEGRDRPSTGRDRPGSDAVADATDRSHRPTDGGSVRPTDGGSVRPTDGGSVRPTDGGSVRPTDGGSVRPSGMVRPTDGQGDRQTTAADPGSTGMVRPSDRQGTADPDPSQPDAQPDAVADAPDAPSGSVRPPEGRIDVEPPRPPPPPPDESCDDLVRLEPMAMLGRLSDGQIGCLESAFAGARQTQKDRISRLLMSNAWAKNDTRGWEQLTARHLSEVSQSDPDICYKYAVHLLRGRRAQGAIRWANVALENRAVWTGDRYVNNVLGLYRIRAMAAQMLWQRAEEQHASDPTEATNREVQRARDMTKEFAREWYEYGAGAGRDTTQPLQLCISAAGTRDYCEGR